MAATPDGGAWGDPTAPAAGGTAANGGGPWSAWQPPTGAWTSGAASATYPTAGGDAASAATGSAAAAEGQSASNGGMSWTYWTDEQWKKWRLDQSHYYQGWSNRWQSNHGGSEDKFEKDDNDVPSWDGNINKMSVLTYFRKIDL